MSGWLHRDASAWNIMAIEEEERRPAPEYVELTCLGTEQVLILCHSLAAFSGITRCIGMITDGDLAIRWPERDSATSARPFVSSPVSIQSSRGTIRFAGHFAIHGGSLVRGMDRESHSYAPR
jgi:hypothetical protein